MFDKDKFYKFNNLTYSLGKMVRLAEINADNLSKLVEDYLSKNPYEEVFNRNKDCKNNLKYDVVNKFNELTFGMLRNILSCIIKTDQNLHKIIEFNTPEKRKTFTTIYKNYIEDRDKFTHGILFFLYPEFTPVLRIKSEETKETLYVSYTKEVFLSNLSLYVYIQSILQKIRETYTAEIV